MFLLLPAAVEKILLSTATAAFNTAAKGKHKGTVRCATFCGKVCSDDFMTRRARIESATGIYHVMLRGLGRE